MNNFKFKLNKAGVRAVLKSKEIAKLCAKEAANVKKKAGEGYVITEYQGRNRVNASVAAVSDEAKKDCLENNALRKAVGK